MDGAPEQCITCDLNETVCAHVSAAMSPDLLYLVLACNGPDVPTYTLYNVDGTEGGRGNFHIFPVEIQTAPFKSRTGPGFDNLSDPELNFGVQALQPQPPSVRETLVAWYFPLSP